MSERYKITDQSSGYFLTLSIVGWVDIFTRRQHKDIIIESLRYCQANKGLLLYAYVIMSNHVHLIAQAAEGHQLSDIMRDMKKHTAKVLWENISNQPESRREWLQYLFRYFAKQNNLEQNYQIWTHDNHPIEVWSAAVMWQKIEYIHFNPVRAGYVELPESYLYSSAINYQGKKGILEIVFPDTLFGV
jgi:putative transposase